MSDTIPEAMRWHLNGCTGPATCQPDPSAYPLCWTPEQVYADQKRMTDWVRRVQPDKDDRPLLASAMRAAQIGIAVHWPAVAATLRDEVLRLQHLVDPS